MTNTDVSDRPEESGTAPGKSTLPRLVLHADCTTCGRVCEVDSDATLISQFALTHVAETGHIVVLNGTADIPEHASLEPQEVATETTGLFNSPKRLTTLPDRTRRAVSYCICEIKINTLRLVLYFIRQLGFKFEGVEDRLTYEWVFDSTGAFDHWFVLDGRQLTLWNASHKPGFWRLVLRLLMESEFLVGARRWASKQARSIKSENYYCSEPLSLARDSQVSDPQIAVLSDLLERYWKVGCQCREGSVELCGLCSEFQGLRSDSTNRCLSAQRS